MRSTRLLPAWLALAGLVACTTKSPPGPRDDATRTRAEEPHTRCGSDDECLLSCIQPGDCCGAPPFCEQARHYDDHAKIEATRTNCAGFDYSTCSTKRDRVPESVAIPVCRRGRCEAKLEKRQSPPEPIDPSGYDRTCATDADCVVVEAQPCDKCGCANVPISARERERFQAAVAAVKCPPYDIWPEIQCGDCMEPTAVCSAGTCTTR